MSQKRLVSSVELLSNEPLWKRAPARDAEGRALADFMMIIPALKQLTSLETEELIGRLQIALGEHSKQILFADLNLRLRVLWITHKPLPGLCHELVAAIQEHVPEARLVAQRMSG